MVGVESGKRDRTHGSLQEWLGDVRFAALTVEGFGRRHAASGLYFD